MQIANRGFFYSPWPEPHRNRTREILKAHTEIYQYMGKNPYTFVFIVAVAALQTFLAYVGQGRAWWTNLLLGYRVGAVATHVLSMTVHEGAHSLIVRVRLAIACGGRSPS